MQQGTLHSATQVEFNGWLLNTIAGGDSTFDNVLSIIEKIVKVIGIVKKIISLFLIVIIPEGATLEGNLESASDDEFLIAFTDAIEKGYVYPNVYTKSEVDDLLAQYSGSLSGFVSAAGGTYAAPFVFSSLYNQYTGSVATNLLTVSGDTITAVQKGTSGTSNNDKLTTQGYVDEKLLISALDANSTYEKKADLATSVTTASLTLNNKTVTDVSTGGSSNNNKLATQGYVDYTIAGDVSMALSSYLTSSTAASTYQPISGMGNYLTTSDAASTYQTQSGMSNYLTTSNASTIYLAKNSLPYYFDGHNEIGGNYKIIIGSIGITWYYYSSDNTYVTTSLSYDSAFCIIKGDRAIVNCVIYIPKFTNQNNSKYVFIKQIEINNEIYGGMYYAGQFSNNGTMHWRYSGTILGTTHGTPVTVFLEDKTTGNDITGMIQICYYNGGTRYDNINTSEGWQLQFTNVSFYKIPS